MRFFIPDQLIELKYLGGSQPDPAYSKLAKDYQHELDFAFFAVNFNYSKADYEALTMAEKLFIRKAYEDKIVNESSVYEHAFEIAISNCLRKKGKRSLKLWTKKAKQGDKAQAAEMFKIVQENEKKHGNSWVDIVHKGAGRKRPLKSRQKGGAEHI